MKVKIFTSNIDFYFTLLEKLKEGKRPSKISKEMNISKQKIYYYTTRLKELGFVEKKGYGVWEVKRSKKIDLKDALDKRGKRIRGHAFIWKVKPTKKFDWKKHLEKNNLSYNITKRNITRTIIDNKKIWFGKKSIIIYENKSFYGKNAFQSRKFAVYELQKTISKIKNKLGIEFEYYFQPRREHFGMIKNELAQQCNKKGERIIIKDSLDGEWLWIDDSTGMEGELETGGKGFTKDRAMLNKNVQDWYNDHKKHNFNVTPSFLMETLTAITSQIQGVTNNQEIFDKNIELHQAVLEDIRDAINELKTEVKKLKNG